MTTESAEVTSSVDQMADGAQLEETGHYAEAAVEYRRELEQLHESDGSAAEMADLAMGIARCLEQLGNDGGAEAARKLAAALCARRLPRLAR